MKTPDQIDTSFIDLAEGTLGQSPETTVEAKPTTPEEQTVLNKALDEKFAAPVSVVKKPEDMVRAQEISASLSKPVEVPKVPEKNVEQPSRVEEKDKKLSPDEFVGKYGNSGLKRDVEGGFSKSDRSTIALDINSNEVPTLLKVSSAALIPSLGLLGATFAPSVAAAGGLSAFVAGAGLASGLVVGVPLVAAGMIGYTGYKMFKTWRASRAFKNNFGTSVKEQLGH